MSREVSEVLKALGRIPVTGVAYMCLLVGFVALGTFVYALAAGSPLAGMIGLGMILLMAATVVGFRAGAKRLAASNDSGIPIDGANIFAKPLRPDQIDHYLASYRGAQQHTAEVRGHDAPLPAERHAA